MRLKTVKRASREAMVMVNISKEMNLLLKKKHFSEGPTPLPLGFNIIFLLSVVLLRNLSLFYKTKTHIFIQEQKSPLNMAEVIHLPLLTFFFI